MFYITLLLLKKVTFTMCLKKNAWKIVCSHTFSKKNVKIFVKARIVAYSHRHTTHEYKKNEEKGTTMN